MRARHGGRQPHADGVELARIPLGTSGAQVPPMRWALMASLALLLSPAPASAQATSLRIDIDVLPAFEGLGLGFLGALDVGMIIADGVIAASEGERRRAVIDTEMALGVLDLLGAIPAWWWWTQERAPTRQGIALAAPVMMTATGAALVIVAATGYAFATTGRVRVSIVPSGEGMFVGISGTL